MAKRYQNSLAQAANNAGNSIAGAKLYFYESGTSTLANTYEDNALTTPNANPVIADGNGRFGDIFLQPISYRVDLKDADDTLIDQQDPFDGGGFGLNILNVKDFGALGDGSTDDTTAFNATIAAVGTLGGIVYVPPSSTSYMIDATVSVLPTSNVSLWIPKGAVVEAITNTANNYEVIHIDSVSNVSVYGGGHVKGERSTHTGVTGEGGMGIRTDNATGVTILNMVITDGWGDGIYIGGNGGASSQITIRGCDINNNRRNNISVVDGTGGIIDGNQIHNANGTAPQAGIDLEAGFEEDVLEWTISNNNIFGNTGDGIDVVTPWAPTISNVRHITIVGNSVHDNTNSGIAVARMIGCDITGNTCNDNGGEGIHVASGGHLTNPGTIAAVTHDINVTGNNCYNNSKSGIFVDGTASPSDISGVMVSGNCCGRNTEYGIRVDRLTGQLLKDIVVTGNNCAVNTKNGIYFNRTIDCSALNNVLTENVEHGILVDGSQPDTIGSIISNNISKGNTLTGIFVAYANKSAIVGNKCEANGTHGIDVFEMHDSSITANILTGNSQTTDDTFIGLIIRRADDCVIANNVVRHDGGANQQKYGIEIDSLADRNLVVDNNLVNSGKTANLLNSSSTTRISDNLGFLTEANGTGSITSGGTTDVITHGLSVTPVASDIVITLTEDPTNTPGAIFVNTITSTQFTVNCESDPGVSNLDFGWRAAVLTA